MSMCSLVFFQAKFDENYECTLIFRGKIIHATRRKISFGILSASRLYDDNHEILIAELCETHAFVYRISYTFNSFWQFAGILFYYIIRLAVRIPGNNWQRRLCSEFKCFRIHTKSSRVSNNVVSSVVHEQMEKEYEERQFILWSFVWFIFHINGKLTIKCAILQNFLACEIGYCCRSATIQHITYTILYYGCTFAFPHLQIISYIFQYVQVLRSIQYPCELFQIM